MASFLTATHGNPVVRAAIAHAQFETIHPFIDGNRRTGRALIHTVLRRCDALRHTLIPISTVFAARTDVYLAGLTSYRDPEPHTDEWVIGFAQAAEQAAQTGVRLARDAAASMSNSCNAWSSTGADEAPVPSYSVGTRSP
ncbi:Fic family protein [Nocardia sp. NBC_00416]|uniref:Fic family protein n=1 Tax=Nocardia sp. NBC_00416 TaxID=2975991 RepID=UPI002E1EE96B